MFSTERRKTNNQPKPNVLKGRDVPSLAEYITSGKCKKVVLMVCLSKACSSCRVFDWAFKLIARCRLAPKSDNGG